MKLSRPFLFYPLIAWVAWLSPLCAENRPLHVVTLSTILDEVAREVGGDQVSVIGLVRPGVDPHTFDPSPLDMRAMAQADVVLASGLNLEPYFDRLFQSAGMKKKVIKVGDALPKRLVLAHIQPEIFPTGGSPQTQAEPDPHWWHSIDNMISATRVVQAEWSRLRLNSTDLFARNADAYCERLQALKTWTIEQIAKLPLADRHLVTSHDAFGYFARDYGFIVHPVNGLSTEGEADAKHVSELIGTIRREKIRAIYAENNVSPRIIENIVSETGVRSGGTLYADGLGSVGTDATTYEAMYKHNVSTIVRSLLKQ